MKIATTIAEVLPYVEQDPVRAVKCYEDSGFRFLDYSFYHMLNLPNHPLMGEDWKDVIRAVQKASAEAGIQWVQAHLPACKLIGEGKEAGLKACLRAIEACGMLGIQNAVIHSSFGEGDFQYPQDKEAYFAANKPFFEALIPSMERFDVNVLLENSCEVNTGGKYFPMTAQDLNEFVAYLGHPKFGACWDIGHANIQGLDQHDELVALGKNLKAVHIHDNNGKQDQHRTLFNGSLDWDSFLRGIVDSSFEGPFTYEIDGHLPYRKDPAPIAALRWEKKLQSLKTHYEMAKTLLKAYGIEGE